MTARATTKKTTPISKPASQSALTPEEAKLYQSFASLENDNFDMLEMQHLVYDIATPLFSDLNHPCNKKVIIFLFILSKKEWLIEKFLRYRQKPRRCTFDRIKDRTNITEKQFESIRIDDRPNTYFDLAIGFLIQLEIRIAEWIEYLKRHRLDTEIPAPKMVEALGNLLYVLGMSSEDIMIEGRAYIELKKQGRPTNLLNSFFAQVITKQLTQYRIQMLWLSLRLNFTQLRRLHKKNISMNVNKTGDGFNLRFFRRDATKTEIKTPDTDLFESIFRKLRTAILKNKTDETSPMMPALHP